MELSSVGRSLRRQCGLSRCDRRDRALRFQFGTALKPENLRNGAVGFFSLAIAGHDATGRVETVPEFGPLHRVCSPYPHMVGHGAVFSYCGLVSSIRDQLSQ